MEAIMDNPLGTALALLFLLEFFNLITKVAENLRTWRKPAQATEERLDRHDRLLDKDNKRLNDLSEGQSVLIQGVRALLWHGRTGNSVDKLSEAAGAIDKYLTDRKIV